MLATVMESIATKSKAGETVNIALEMKELPVPLRATLALVALAAADKPINGVNMAQVGGYSRGTAAVKHKATLDTLVRSVPVVVGVQLQRTSETPTISELAAQIRNRDNTIADLRAQLSDARHDLDVVLAYARDLHNHVQLEHDQIAAEKAKKVRLLRPVTESDTQRDGPLEPELA